MARRTQRRPGRRSATAPLPPEGRATTDMVPRYAPTEVMTLRGGVRPVLQAIFHPAGTHPGSTIRPDMGALELVTDQGSRWWGFEGGAINSELRMTVWGFDSRDEVRRGWEIVPERLRVPQSRALAEARPREARRYPTLPQPPHHHVLPRAHRVADFNTLDDLITHARDELGATHVLVAGSNTKLYFPRGGQYEYEEAGVWRKSGYWHAQGPGARIGVARLPRDAVPLDEYIGWQKRTAAEARRGRRPDTKHDPDPLSGPRKAQRDEAISQAVEGARSSSEEHVVWMDNRGAYHVARSLDFPRHRGRLIATAYPNGTVAYGRLSEARRPRGGAARRAPTTWTTDNTQINTWFERDRASVVLETLDGTSIIEWWDEAVEEAVQDGFLDSSDWHGSAVEYANHVGAQVAREATRSPRGGSTGRISNRAPQMTPESVMKIASDLSRKVGGSAPKHIGAHRWSDANESAVFATYSPEHHQPVIVLVSVFADGTLALDFFSDEYLSETNRYENIVHFLYSMVDLGEMAADLKWVWETVDGYAESWQQEGDGGGVDEARSGPPDQTGGWAVTQRMMQVYVKHARLGDYVPNSAVPLMDGKGTWTFYARRPNERPEKHTVTQRELTAIYKQQGLSERRPQRGAPTRSAHRRPPKRAPSKRRRAKR